MQNRLASHMRQLSTVYWEKQLGACEQVLEILEWYNGSFPITTQSLTHPHTHIGVGGGGITQGETL